MAEEMLAINAFPVTKSGIITDKSVIVWGYILTGDTIYNVTIEITTADGSSVIFPKCLWPASIRGRKLYTVKGRNVKGGLRVEAITKGHFELIPLYQNWM